MARMNRPYKQNPSMQEEEIEREEHSSWCVDPQDSPPTQSEAIEALQSRDEEAREEAALLLFVVLVILVVTVGASSPTAPSGSVAAFDTQNKRVHSYSGLWKQTLLRRCSSRAKDRLPEHSAHGTNEFPTSHLGQSPWLLLFNDQSTFKAKDNRLCLLNRTCRI